MAALFTDVLIYNDLRDQRAIVYKRFKRVVEYIFSNYEIKPKQAHGLPHNVYYVP